MNTPLAQLVALVGMVPMQSFTDWVNAQSKSAQQTLNVVIGVGLTVMFAYGVFKAKFAIAAILTGLLGAGLVWWVVNQGGIAFVANLFNDQK